MRSLLRKFWHDDAGSLLGTEWTFIATILVLGLIVGFVAVRQAVVSEMTELGNVFLAVSDAPTPPVQDKSVPAAEPASVEQNCCD
jgi:hypothetical protein